MATFFIRTVNSDFETQTDVGNCAGADDAMALGVRGAVAILSGDVDEGSNAASIVVTVQDADKTPVLRSVVSISVASLYVS